MKNTILLALVLSLGATLSAQEDSGKTREIGLMFNNLNNFGFTYRIGTEQSLWRFQGLLFSGSSNTASTSSTVNQEIVNRETVSNNFSARLQAGKEFRKPITKQLQARYGIDIQTTGSILKAEEKLDGTLTSLIKTQTLGVGSNLVFGLNLLLGTDWKIGAEWLPGVTYSMEKRYTTTSSNTTDTNLKGLVYGASIANSHLSIIYTF